MGSKFGTRLNCSATIISTIGAAYFVDTDQSATGARIMNNWAPSIVHLDVLRSLWLSKNLPNYVYPYVRKTVYSITCRPIACQQRVSCILCIAVKIIQEFPSIGGLAELCAHNLPALSFERRIVSPNLANWWAFLFFFSFNYGWKQCHRLDEFFEFFIGIRRQCGFSFYDGIFCSIRPTVRVVWPLRVLHVRPRWTLLWHNRHGR